MAIISIVTIIASVVAVIALYFTTIGASGPSIVGKKLVSGGVSSVKGTYISNKRYYRDYIKLSLGEDYFRFIFGAFPLLVAFCHSV